MSFEFLPISKSLLIQHRPLTQLALDNKIRAIISQFHPYERQFISISHGNNFDRIHRRNFSIKQSKFRFAIFNSMIQTNKNQDFNYFSWKNNDTNESISDSNKVTQWLEHFHCNYNDK